LSEAIRTYLIVSVEIKKEFYIKANQWLLEEKQVKLDFKQFGFDKSRMEKNNGLTLFS